MKYNKVNFLYRKPTSIYSSYMFFEGLEKALKRNNLLYYSYAVGGKKELDMEKLLKYPVISINSSWEPVFGIVKLISGKQFVAEINSEFMFDNDYFQEKNKVSLPSFSKIKKYLKILKSSPRVRSREFLEQIKLILKVKILHNYSYPSELLEKRSKHIDLYFSGIEKEVNKCINFLKKPCYWYSSWAHTEILKENGEPRSDKILFVGALHEKRKRFFDQDKNKIIKIKKTIPQKDSLSNIKELNNLINKYKYTICPVGIVDQYVPGKIFECLACKKLCFCYLPGNSGYSQKVKDFFEDGKDIVYFKDFHELEEKYNYFLNHPEESERIARSGCEKVRKYHNADVRAKMFAEIVLHHANGGEYNNSYNNILLFGEKYSQNEKRKQF